MLTRASRVFPAIFLAGSLLLITGSARATTMIALPLAQLTAQAGAIVHGTVTGVRSDWNAGRTHIFTFVTVHVDQSLKGSLGPDITVMEFGGTVGNLRQYMPGAPQFRSGEEVVLFLSLHPPMYPSVLALSQGKFSVVADRSTGTRMISRSLYGAAVRGPSEALSVPPTLSAFESQVRALVAGHRPKAKLRKPGKQEP